MTAKDLKEFQKLIKICKQNKISQFKFKDIEVSFFYDQPVLGGTLPPFYESKAYQFEKDSKPKPIPDHEPIKEEIMPEEDMLLWSTPHYQEEKPQANGDIEQ